MSAAARDLPVIQPLPRPLPARIVLHGRYVRLEPVDDLAHGDALHAASSVPDVADRFRFLFDQPPVDRADLARWIERSRATNDPMAFAVVDEATGRAGGRQSLMRITPEHGVIEIGNIYWGPGIAGTRLATEAQFLFAQYAFDGLGYRRYEWKCDNRNEPSKRAALRFGFRPEGVFRQHMVIKGENRDTAWFSMLDHEWPMLKAGYLRWLDPRNFDATGRQRQTLVECIPPGIPGLVRSRGVSNSSLTRIVVRSRRPGRRSGARSRRSSRRPVSG